MDVDDVRGTNRTIGHTFILFINLIVVDDDRKGHPFLYINFYFLSVLVLSVISQIDVSVIFKRKEKICLRQLLVESTAHLYILTSIRVFLNL